MSSQHKYLGEKEFGTNYEGTPYNGFTASDWAMRYIGSYGQIDGSFHKQWVLDQVARILKGTPVLVKLASWDDGQTEWRYNTGKPSKEYLEWVEKMKDLVDGEYQYDYDVGGAP